MTVDPPSIRPTEIVVGVLALQGAFSEHIQLLRQAAAASKSSLSPPTTTTATSSSHSYTFKFIEVRTPTELAQCEALIIPGGESTTISLVAERSNMLEPLREFVKVQRKPVWGTCAGMILLAERANRVKKGGQELIGGLDVRVDRNHFGRQVESFEKDVELPFLGDGEKDFHAVFIRAPIVEAILPADTTVTASTTGNDSNGEEVNGVDTEKTVQAPSKMPKDSVAAAMKGNGEVQVLGKLLNPYAPDEAKNVVAVLQGNCFGTSFHPELGTDARIHSWWLEKVVDAVRRKEEMVAEAMQG